MGNVAEPTEEIDDMLGALEDSAPEPEPEEEPPEETEDSEEPEPQAQKDVQAAEEGEEEPTSEVEELKKEIETLKNQLSEEGEEEAEEKNQQEPETSSEQQNEELEVKVDFEGEEFLDEEAHGEVLTNPEDFNNFLKNFAEKIAARTQEEILQKFPQLVDQRVRQRASAEVTMQRFWNENPDLNTESKRKVLASKAQKVRSEEPNKPLEEVLDEAEKRTREELDLQEKAEKVDEEAQQEPAFTPDQGTGPAPSQEDSRDEQVKQMDEMLDAIG